MAAVPLIRDTDMASLMSCENTLAIVTLISNI